MSHTIQFEISDQEYAVLVEAAEKAGQEPESLAARALLTFISQNHQDDPFLQFIGAIPTEKWADNHDELVGQSILDEMVTPRSGKADE